MRCAVLVRDLRGNSKWTQMEDLRGINYHRWRIQSPGIRAVARKSPWQERVTDAGTRVREMGIGDESLFGDSSQYLELEHEVVCQGLRLLEGVLRSFRRHWTDMVGAWAASGGRQSASS